MKVGIIAAPCRYDAASRDALQSEAVAAKSHSIVQCRTVARPKRFELLTPRFVVWFGCTQPDLTERLAPQNFWVIRVFHPVASGCVPLHSAILRPRCVPRPAARPPNFFCERNTRAPD